MEPIYPWMGGKRRLVSVVVSRLHALGGCHTYYEPFLGGGAIWLALAPPRAVLSDLNPDVINFWQCLQADPVGLWRAVGGPLRVDQAEFYRLRALDPGALAPVERAARFLALVANAFGRRFRVNGSGVHNAPYNHNPRGADRLDEPNYWAIANYLASSDVVFRHQPSSASLAQADARDVVYLDPPYADTSDRYTAGGFDHTAFLADLAACRARWLLSHHAPTSVAGYAALPLVWQGPSQWSLKRGVATQEVLYASQPVPVLQQLPLALPLTAVLS